jgi:hypothetical protein
MPSSDTRQAGRRIFLSYSFKDSEAAEAIRESLSRNGAEVWSTQDLRPGDNVAASIQHEINEADDVVILVSTSSEGSSWIDYEAAAAIAARQTGTLDRIIPVLLDPKAKPPPALAQFQYLDFSHQQSWADQLDRLESSLSDQGADLTLSEEIELEQQQLRLKRLALEEEQFELEARYVRLEGFLHLTLTLIGTLSILALVILGLLGVFGSLSGSVVALLGLLLGLFTSRVSLDFRSFRRWRR